MAAKKDKKWIQKLFVKPILPKHLEKSARRERKNNMDCSNPTHHIKNQEPCKNHNGCSCGNNGHGHNPHDHHYHINKHNLKIWLLNAAYLSLHAVTIYLLVK
jgi:hypothetical protein